MLAGDGVEPGLTSAWITGDRPVLVQVDQLGDIGIVLDDHDRL